MQISIKYVNFPRPGGKYGNIKAVDGSTVMIPPDLLGLFRAGQTVEIGTKTQTWGQGTAEERVVTVATTGPLDARTGPVQAQGVQPGYGGPVQGQPSQRPNTSLLRPRVIQGGPVGVSQTDQARHIFVTGCVGRALGSGKFAASEIRVLTQAANEAYDLIGKPATPPPVLREDQPGWIPGDEPGDPGPEPQ
jgi:hypothetical protein